jgi:hypothetical protein
MPGPSRRAVAVGSLLHVLMSVAMISMFWSWGARIPVIAQVMVFTAAAAWFAGHAVFGAGANPGGDGYASWYHAGMMATMVWVAVAMTLVPGPFQGTGAGGTAVPSGGGMAGMDMGGGNPAVSMSAAGPPGKVSLFLAVIFATAALWEFFATLWLLADPAARQASGAPASPPGGAAHAVRSSAGALMAAGLAAALFQMA